MRQAMVLSSTRLSSRSGHQTGLNTASETDGCRSDDSGYSRATEVIYRVIVEVYNGGFFLLHVNLVLIR